MFTVFGRRALFLKISVGILTLPLTFLDYGIWISEIMAEKKPPRLGGGFLKKNPQKKGIFCVLFSMGIVLLANKCSPHYQTPSHTDEVFNHCFGINPLLLF